MKKIITIMMVLVMVFSLCACGGGSNETAEERETVSEETTEQTEATEEEEIDRVAYKFEGEPTELLTVEEVIIEPWVITSEDNANYFKWRIKVRNTSGEDLVPNDSSMRIFFNYLDENEDILYDSYLTAGYPAGVKAGRAETVDDHGYPADWSKADLEAVTYIELYGFTTDLSGTPEHIFENAILINVKDHLK